MKNFSQNLFTTLDNAQSGSTMDIGKRTKTEITNNHHRGVVGFNSNHIKSMQAFDTQSNNTNDIDPYNILMTLDSQRMGAKTKGAVIIEDYTKKGMMSISQLGNGGSGIMQKM